MIATVDVHRIQRGSLNFDEYISLGYFGRYRCILILHEGFGRITPPDYFPDGLNRG